MYRSVRPETIDAYAADYARRKKKKLVTEHASDRAYEDGISHAKAGFPHSTSDYARNPTNMHHYSVGYATGLSKLKFNDRRSKSVGTPTKAKAKTQRKTRG